MKCAATIRNNRNQNSILVSTNEADKKIDIPPKLSGYGSSINGGELLLLALATCFCNDLYREATKRNLKITEVEVSVTGDFESEGEAGSNFKYSVNIKSNESTVEIEKLVKHTDEIAEIHKTLRKGTSITLIKN